MLTPPSVCEDVTQPEYSHAAAGSVQLSNRLYKAKHVNPMNQQVHSSAFAQEEGKHMPLTQKCSGQFHLQ